MAYLAAVVAMMSRDSDARATALDALIEGIEDGRAHPRPLGDVVVRFFEPGWAKTNRLAAALEERIFFAGEATHPTFFSAAHGAFESGTRAAREALEALQRQAN